MSKRVPVLPGIQPSTSAYSQVVEANGFVFVAGQVGDDKETGDVVPGGIEAETRAMFANVERCLAAIGLGLGDIVKSTVYLGRHGGLGRVHRGLPRAVPDRPADPGDGGRRRGSSRRSGSRSR